MTNAHTLPRDFIRDHEEVPAETALILLSRTEVVTILPRWASPFPLSHGATLLRLRKCSWKQTCIPGTNIYLLGDVTVNTQSSATETMPSGGRQLGTHAEDSRTLWAGNRPWTVSSPCNRELMCAATSQAVVFTSEDRIQMLTTPQRPASNETINIQWLKIREQARGIPGE